MIHKSQGLYPTLFLLPKAARVLRREERIEIVRMLEKKTEQPVTKAGEAPYALELFELLRMLRKEIADEQGIPPYVVFSDRTLHEMAATLPQTDEALLTVSGVGEVKLQRYGQQFLRLIDRYWSDRFSVRRVKQ